MNKEQLKAKLAKLTPQQRKEMLARTQEKKRQLKKAADAAKTPTTVKVPSELKTPGLSEQQLQDYASTGVSNAQVRMWMFEKFNDSGAAYNIASAMHLQPDQVKSADPGQEVSVEGIEWAMNQIIAGHENLRSYFIEVNGLLKTHIQPAQLMTIDQLDAPQWQLPEHRNEVEQQILQWAELPIDLATPPLMGLKSIRLADNSLVLVLLMHHIIADGWSLRLLEQNLSQLYIAWLGGERNDRTPAKEQYQHFVGWQQQWLEGPKAVAQLDYWKQQLAGAPEQLNLPCDPACSNTLDDLSAKSHILNLSAGTVAQVEQFGQAQRLSPFMVYLAAFNLMLANYTGDEDIVVGTPVANRRSPWIEPIIGLVSNSIALRSVNDREQPLADYLKALRKTTLDAFANQELPFEQVVDAVASTRSGNLPPLYQVLFALQASEESDLKLPGVTIKPIEMPRHGTEFALMTEMFISAKGGFVNFTYQTARFSEATVTALADAFATVLAQIIADEPLSIGATLTKLTPKSNSQTTNPLSDNFAVNADDAIYIGSTVPDKAAAQLKQHCANVTTDASTARWAFAMADDKDVWQQVTCVQQVHINSNEFESSTKGLWFTDQAGFVLSKAGNQISSPYPLNLCNEVGEPLLPGFGGNLCIEHLGHWQPLAIAANSAKQPLALQPVAGCAWINHQYVDLNALTAKLLLVEGIAEGICLPRQIDSNTSEIVFYAVPDSRMGQAAIEKRCLAQIGAEYSLTLCLLTQLPRDAQGLVAVQALTQYPVLNSQTCELLDVRCKNDDASWSVVPARFNQATVTLAQSLASKKAVNDSDEKAVQLPPASYLANDLPMEIDNLHALLDHAVTIAPDMTLTTINGFNEDDSIASQQTFTYQQLQNAGLRVAAGLKAQGVKKGDVVMSQLTYNRDILEAFWGCVYAGAVFMNVEKPVDYNDDQDAEFRRVEHTFDVLSVQLVLSTDQQDVQAFEETLGAQFKTRAAALSELREFEPLSQPESVCAADKVIMMLTSGSTGKPKVVVQDHEAVCCHARGFARALNANADSCVFNWMPMQHVVAIMMSHTVYMYVGARQVHCATGAILERPIRLLDMFTEYRANYSCAANFAFALINDALVGMDKADLAAKEWDLKPMQSFINCGESVVHSTSAEFVNHLAPFGFSRTAIAPGWGMSETCSVTLMNTDYDPLTEIDSNYVSCGPGIEGMSYRIVDADDQVMEQGRNGRLQVKGPLVLEGYCNNSAANARDFSEDGWFSTGDLAIMNDNEVAIVGREKDLIIINGLNFQGLDIELCVESLDCIMGAYSAACAVRRAGDNTDKLCVFYSPEPQTALSHSQICDEIRQISGKQLGIVPNYIVPLEPQVFPRTSLGKIQRSQIAKEFELGQFDHLLQGAQQLQTPNWYHSPQWQAEQLISTTSNHDLVVLLANEAATVEPLKANIQAASNITTQISDIANVSQVLGNYPDAKSVALVDCRSLEQAVDTNWLSAADGLGAIWALVTELANDDRQFSLNVLTQNAYTLEGNDAQVAEPVLASVAGALAAIGAEFVNFQGKLLSCDNLQLAALSHELCQRNGANNVLLNQGKRLVLRLKPVFKHSATLRTAVAADSPPSLKVVLGGLGGVGAALCQSLLESTDDHVVAVGRRTQAQMAEQSEYAQRLEMLAEFGPRFGYIDCDITSPQALSDCFAALAEKHQLALGQVYHLAGLAQPMALAQQTTVQLEAVLSAKVQGCVALSKALETHKQVKQIHFSSLTAIYGGNNMTAYSLANAFQSAWCEQQKQQGADVDCLLWSMWDQTGMSADSQDSAAVRAAGYHLLSIEQGLLSLQMTQLMNAEQAVMAVGLDDHAMPMFMGVRGAEHVAFEIKQKSQENDNLSWPKVDSHGATLRYRGADGAQAIDETALLANESYQVIKSILQQLLQQDELAADANFFELGGDSILAIQCVAAAAEQGVHFTPRDLFEQQTPARLLNVISQGEGTPEQSAGTAEVSTTELVCFDQVNPTVLPELAKLYDTDESQLYTKLSHVLPATAVQVGMLFESLLVEGRGLYVTQLINDISGDLDVECLRLGWQQVLNNHSIYRTGFVVSTSGQYVQAVHRHCDIPFTVQDWQGISEELQEEKFAHLQQRECQRDFDFAHPPLIRICLVKMAPQRYRMLMSEHHCVTDGWSRALILNVVTEAYRHYHRQLNGSGGELPAILSHQPTQYYDYVSWQQQYDASSANQYWQQLPLGDVSCLPLGAQKLPNDEPNVSVEANFLVSAATSTAATQAARKARVTIGALLQASWAVLLSGYMNSENVAFATTHSGRPPMLAGVNDIVGPLINTAPMVAEVTANTKVEDVVQQMHTQLMNLGEQGYLSMNDIGELHGRKDLSEAFNTLFVVENFPLTPPDAHDEDDLRIDGVRSTGSTEFPVSFAVVPASVPGGEIKLIVYYLQNRFDAEQIALMSRDYEAVLAAMAASFNAPLAQLNWLSDERSQQIAQGLQAITAVNTATDDLDTDEDDDDDSESFEF